MKSDTWHLTLRLKPGELLIETKSRRVQLDLRLQSSALLPTLLAFLLTVFYFLRLDAALTPWW